MDQWLEAVYRGLKDKFLLELDGIALDCVKCGETAAVVKRSSFTKELFPERDIYCHLCFDGFFGKPNLTKEK